MFKKKDPYSFTKFVRLQLNGNLIGTIRLDYQVDHFEDVKISNVGAVAEQKKSRQYLLSCTQTINLFNPNGLNLSPSSTLNSYSNYPVLLNANIEPGLAPGYEVDLIEYSPQTVNTKVQASGSSGTSSGSLQGVTSSSTVGSTTAETNSYGASVTLAEAPSFSANYEHSSTTTSEHSSTAGTESSQSRGREQSAGSSMSIKDWGAYALVNPALKSVVWTFGQERPWDAVECRSTNGNLNAGGQTQIVIPSAMQANLYDGVSLYPPSHLSSFGINFVMKAIWLVRIANGTPSHADTFTLEHNIDYFSGSHSLVPVPAPDTGNVAAVFIDPKPATLQPANAGDLSTSLDLGVMALDPIGKGRGNAIVGFITRKFVVEPAPFSQGGAPAPFEIFSNGNNLLIRDTTVVPSPAPTAGGFAASETALLAIFEAGLPSLSMTLYFKVVDVDSEYALYIKHWVTDPSGVTLQIVVNGDTDHPINTFVVAHEAEGGEANLTRINLRNLDFTSIDYSDLLQVGLNSIEITIRPIAPAAGSTYKIRAISVESE